MIFALCFLTAFSTALICALCVFGGYIIGKKEKEAKKIATKTEVDDRLSREAKIRQQQIQNFWAYNGDEQPDPVGYISRHEKGEGL